MAPVAPVGESPELYMVVYDPRVFVRAFPDSKSAKICAIHRDEVVTTYEWDASLNWRRVWVENDAGDEQDGWMQVESESLGSLLVSMGPVGEATLSNITNLAAPDLLDSGAAPSKQQRPGRFSMAAQDKGMRHPSDRDSTVDGTKAPPRSRASQLYKVVFPSHIPVREQPSMTANALRALKSGALVKCFEWDISRKWRRVTVEVPVEDIKNLFGGRQERQEPVLACPIRDELIKNPIVANFQECDGWVLTYHPIKGQLLEAVLDAGDEHASPKPDVRASAATQPELRSPAGPSKQGARGSASPAQQAANKEWPRQSWQGWQQPNDGMFDFGPSDWQESPVVTMAKEALAHSHKIEQRILELEKQKRSALERENNTEADRLEQRLSFFRNELQQPSSSSELELARKQEQKGLIIPEKKLDEILRSVEDRPSLGEPRIMRAVRAGSYEAVASIIASWANPNETDPLGESALFEAASGAHTDIVARLLLCHADPRHTNQNGSSALMVATHEPTKALILRWQGRPVADIVLNTALLLCRQVDRGRIAKKLGVLDPQEDDEANLLYMPPERPTATALEQAVASSEVQTVDVSIPEAATLEVHDSAAFAAAIAEHAVRPPSPSTPVEAASSSAPVANADGSAPGAPQLEDLQLDERGVPMREAVGTKHRVVYKMVVVRRFPDKNAAQIRAFKLGDVVDMFEWDYSRRYRRITIEFQEVDGGPLVLGDGWMLIYSDKFGALLQEVPREEEDDEAAG